MAALPRFLKHWTVRILALYVLLFAVSVVTLLGFVYGVTIGLIDRQINAAIQAEITSLSDGYRDQGLQGLIGQIAERISADRVGGGVYLLTDPDRNMVAGNLDHWPNDAEWEGRWATFRLTSEGEDEPSPDAQQARAFHFFLNEGYHLLVGRSLKERESFEVLILQALFWALLAAAGLAVVGGFVMGREMRRRLEGINQTTRHIMDGDLQQRVPLTGSGDELDSLAVNLNDMLATIDRLLKAGREVTDNIAHDLRSPLTRLKTRLEVTLLTGEGGAQTSPEALRAVLEDAVDETDNILKTFNAILSIAQAEAGAGRRDMTDLDLAALIADVCDLYEALAEEKEISFSFVPGAEALPVHGNRHLLFQAIANLLDNAVKYTPQGGRVTVETAVQDGSALLSVSDSGPGIPAAERDHVLQRFVRLEQSRTTPGNGLGLSLVSAVVGLHHGRLDLGDAAPGLRVTLAVPMMAAAGSRPA
jgi:signal transduction histidine kinase